jgi:uncharacterized protein (TIGR03000 family)
MKKFVGLAALGLVALLAATPQPAAARSFGIGGIGRISGIGRIGGIGGFRGWGFRGIGWRGYGLSGGYRFHRFHHGAWRGDYYYAYPGAAYYDPYPAYYPEAGASYSEPHTAYYPPELPDNGNAVTIRMTVPSGARVYFDGAATSQTGADRAFVSPPLTPGREYVYQIRVQWEENGKTTERNRKVTVHAGDRVNLTIDR